MKPSTKTTSEQITDIQQSVNFSRRRCEYINADIKTARMAIVELRKVADRLGLLVDRVANEVSAIENHLNAAWSIAAKLEE